MTRKQRRRKMRFNFSQKFWIVALAASLTVPAAFAQKPTHSISTDDFNKFGQNNLSEATTTRGGGKFSLSGFRQGYKLGKICQFRVYKAKMKQSDKPDVSQLDANNSILVTTLPLGVHASACDSKQDKQYWGEYDGKNGSYWVERFNSEEKYFENDAPSIENALDEHMTCINRQADAFANLLRSQPNSTTTTHIKDVITKRM